MTGVQTCALPILYTQVRPDVTSQESHLFLTVDCKISNFEKEITCYVINVFKFGTK